MQTCECYLIVKCITADLGREYVGGGGYNKQYTYLLDLIDYTYIHIYHWIFQKNLQFSYNV